MNKENMKRIQKTDKKTVMVTVRITPKMSEWLHTNQYSPTGILYEAIKELGFKA